VPASLPSGLNAGFVGGLLEQYLENPEAVDPAWRALFEHADDDVLTTLPGLARLVRARPAEDGNGAPAAILAPPAPEPAVEEQPVEEPAVEVPPAPPVEPAPIPAEVDVELIGDLPNGARPDLSVDGTIEIERLANVVFMGRPAYGQPNTKISIFKLVEDGRYAVRVPVELGRTSVNAVEIVQGLTPGDEVILSDTSAWDDNDRIRLN